MGDKVKDLELLEMVGAGRTMRGRYIYMYMYVYRCPSVGVVHEVRTSATGFILRA